MPHVSFKITIGLSLPNDSDIIDCDIGDLELY